MSLVIIFWFLIMEFEYSINVFLQSPSALFSTCNAFWLMAILCELVSIECNLSSILAILSLIFSSNFSICSLSSISLLVEALQKLSVSFLRERSISCNLPISPFRVEYSCSLSPLVSPKVRSLSSCFSSVSDSTPSNFTLVHVIR